MPASAAAGSDAARRRRRWCAPSRRCLLRTTFAVLGLAFLSSKVFEKSYLERVDGAVGVIVAVVPPQPPRVGGAQEGARNVSRQSFPTAAATTPVPAWKGCKQSWPTPWQAYLPLQFPREAQPKTKIPKIVHFVFGYKVDAPPVFTFLNFAAVVSALAVIRPARVMMHFGIEPIGFLWELVRPHVKLVRGRNVQSIFGNPVEDYAHKADIIRLEALLKHGGIYLDIDVVTLRSFDKLLNYDVVMGEEGVDGKVGLCNGVIVAAPGAKFVKEWYSQYRTFNKTMWNFHSVKLPMKLAKKNPSWIYRLPYQKFHWPLWDVPGMKLMMDSFDYDYAKNLAVHVWSHGLLRSPYRNFSMEWCYECHSTLVSKFRSLVPDPLFSFVLSCDVHGRRIRDSLQRVLYQTFPSWEVIVVDGANTSDCGLDAQSFATAHALNDEKRFRLVANAANSTRQVSKNVAIQASRGVWICILYPTVEIHKDFLYTAVQAMGSESDLQVLTAGEHGFEKPFWFWDVPIAAMTSPLARGSLPPTMLYLRDLWLRVGGYTNALPWGSEDVDFCTKIVLVGVRYHTLPQSLVTVRTTQPNAVMQPGVDAAEELAMVMSLHPELLHPARLVEEHRRIINMSQPTQTRLASLQASGSLNKEDAAIGKFWLGLADIRQENYAAAVEKFSGAMQARRLHWQPALYHALCICRVNGSNASAIPFAELAAAYPILRKTAPFASMERECVHGGRWVFSAAGARDA